MPGGWEIALIVLVVFLLFGATRLPNAARSLGRSMRIFKSEMDEMKSDKKDAKGQAIAQGSTEGPAEPNNINAQDANAQAQPQVQQPDTQNVTKPEGDAR